MKCSGNSSQYCYTIIKVQGHPDISGGMYVDGATAPQAVFLRPGARAETVQGAIPKHELLRD